MQKYQEVESHGHIKSLRILQELPKKQASCLFVVLSQEYIKTFSPEAQFENLYLKTIHSYLTKSKELLNDIKNGKQIKLYTFNEETFPFCYVQISQKNEEEGAQIIRKAQSQIEKLKPGQLESDKNSVTILLPDEYTVLDINRFLLGLQLANYRFSHQTIKVDGKVSQFSVQHVNVISKISQAEFDEQNKSNWENKILSELPIALNTLKSLVPKRPNEATTTYMANYVQQFKSDQVKLTIIQGDELLDKGLRLIHAVGRASKYPSFLSCLEYTGNVASDSYLALIGKGIVYDSGGLSIKSTSGMCDMYTDKAGACTVLEAFRLIVKLQMPVNVICTTAFAENSVGSDSYRNSDILQSYKGLTVEILNTDCEGRLILADAMSYTQDNFKIAEIIELSTLTGTMKTALGKMCGVFSNKQQSLKLLKKAQQFSNEEFWPLPLNAEHRGYIQGQVTDIVNSGEGRVPASTAAAFLETFVEKKVKWMHWDIANVVKSDKNEGIFTKGATGFGLQTIIYYIAIQNNLIQPPKKQKQVDETEQETQC